jgi:hypothetical protein
MYKSEKLPVYIMTSNKTMRALQASSYLFNKFWPYETQVNVLGYNLPDFDLPKNYNYISLGVQRGINYWSDDMIDFFTKCEDDLFYLTFEDAFIVHSINKELLEYAYEFCQNNMENLLRFNLTAELQSRSHDIIEKYEDFDLIESKQHEIFRLALNHSIWNRKQFLNKLKRNENPHFFESPNKHNSKNDGLGVYGLKRKYILHYGEGYRRGKKVAKPYIDILEKYTGYSGLNQDDIDLIEENNWLPVI